MSETVMFSIEAQVARLTLNNPEKHNALGRRELDAIHAALEAVTESATVRALVLTGTGDKTFCAGASLEQLNTGEIRGDDYQDMTDALAALAIPTVCAINGNVFGGGVELALSCDFRIGIEGTRLRVPAASLGLCYPVRGIQRFVQRLGSGVARRILVASETMDADEMLRIGFLDHLVMPAQLEQTVQSYAEQLAGLAPLAVRAMKQIIAGAAAGKLDLDEAEALAARCAASDDLAEGFAAQRAKRPPEFRGR
ncbi:enoyl-CoA hydratase/isomerase family protein [Pseudohaliea rubra]|uniref:Enoyl-CoA hydratase n=1 Tax=Pseudohaliea rubra DSM 19751 TaxID=1265313 RepID=A0A095VUL5_9GAMM|nr:enoyl-CoA hydratase-related protein [Pseudohaliea rubra]KGE04768.1 Enoyl-CoA hydratase [Pseudohaliea rubra DSM 19751]